MTLTVNIKTLSIFYITNVLSPQVRVKKKDTATKENGIKEDRTPTKVSNFALTHCSESFYLD